MTEMRPATRIQPAWIAWLAAWALVLLPGAALHPAEEQLSPPEKAPATRARLAPDARPAGRMQLGAAPPDITSTVPRSRIMAGGTITFYGNNLRGADFVARLGTHRPVVLPVLDSSSSRIRVKVPEHLAIAAAPLVVQYTGGQTITLEDNFRVFAPPRFSNLSLNQSPSIGRPMQLELTVADFGGLENEEITFWPNCTGVGRSGGRLPAVNQPARIKFEYIFAERNPSLSPAQRLLALSGKRCNIEASFGSGGVDGRVPTGLSVQLPSVALYTIEQTWDLQGFRTPSGRTFRASMSSVAGICGPLSVGSAGSFPVGVVKHHNDISFQMRNGVTNLACDFSTSPRLRVKPDWTIVEVDWQTMQDSNCRAASWHREWAPGQWGFQPPLNPEFLDRERVNVTCVVDAQDRLRNGHLFRAVLRKVVLLGPPGQNWRAAFQ